MKRRKQTDRLPAPLVGCLILLFISLTIGGAPQESKAGWSDLLKKGDTLLQDMTGAEEPPGETSLSTVKIAQGLKEALQLGVTTAIQQLGRPDGFSGDQEVRIPLPERLQKVERLLESIGQKQLGEQLVASMNRAAEEAVPEVVDIFADTLSQMSLADAQAILKGQDDAATSYFKTHSADMLRQRVSPYVKQAMDKVQVSHYYHALVGVVQEHDSLGLLNQYLGQASDLNGYVTGKAVDGLFVKIAEQEKLIRDDPAARSTDLLRQVFGSVR